MRIPDLITPGVPSFSFEFFPPRTEEGRSELIATVSRLSVLEPDFASVTYGAAGSTRDGTLEVASRIQNDCGLETMAHLSCVGETIEGLEAVLDELAEAGIENILALRGDPPAGAADFVAPAGGLQSSAELASFIRARGDWGIGGSCFPEIHPEATSREADIAYLGQKVEAGAEVLVSQLFFDNSIFFDWLAEVRATGIEVPVLAGILPVRSYAGLKRFCEVCGANVPEALGAGLEACDGDAEAERAFGIAYAARQSEELLAGGVQGLHFFTLNHADSTLAVLGAIRAAKPWERANLRTGATAG